MDTAGAVEGSIGAGVNQQNPVALSKRERDFVGRSSLFDDNFDSVRDSVVFVFCFDGKHVFTSLIRTE